MTRRTTWQDLKWNDFNNNEVTFSGPDGIMMWRDDSNHWSPGRVLDKEIIKGG